MTLVFPIGESLGAKDWEKLPEVIEGARPPGATDPGERVAPLLRRLLIRRIDETAELANDIPLLLIRGHAGESAGGSGGRAMLNAKVLVEVAIEEGGQRRVASAEGTRGQRFSSG